MTVKVKVTAEVFLMSITQRMINEMNEGKRAVKQFIFDGKHGWEREKKWLNSNKGKFKLEQYVNELWNRNIVEVFREANINEVIIDHWLFSPTCIYS